MTDPAQQPTTRPDWLPYGHAICPGPKEGQKLRMYVDTPGETPHFGQTIFWCEHGEWATQAEAWSDHELSNNTLTPNVDQGAKATVSIRYQDLSSSELATMQKAAQDELDRRNPKELPTQLDV